MSVLILVALGLLAVLVARQMWTSRSARPSAQVKDQRPVIVVDGSNVMYWDNETPSTATLFRVMAALKDKGWRPIAFFDANVGYKLAGRHLDEEEVAALVGLRAQDVLIVSSGVPADPLLIEFAMERDARIVSNDRYMDWRADHPRLRDKGRLVKGRIVGQDVHLNL